MKKLIPILILSLVIFSVMVIESDSSSADTTYTVTFDAMGGTVNPSSKVVTYGQTYGELPTPVRANYIFSGWYIPDWNDHQHGMITADTVVTLDGDKTAYAYWTQPTSTLTFNANGGTVGTASKTVTYGHAYGELPIPTRTGYNFDGWYLNNDANYLIRTHIFHPFW